MAEFCIEIAGQAVQVRSLFESTRDYCAQYLTDREAAHFVDVTREDLAHRQELAFEEARQEGLRPRVFTDPFLERETIQAKIAEALLPEKRLLMHGSAVAVDGVGYLFTAPCRTGKSTHTRLWRELFGNRAVIINDDKPFLRLNGDQVLICGSPWGGKHGLQTNITVPLGGICVLERGSENRISRVQPGEVLPLLLHQGGAPEEECLSGLYEDLVKELSDRVPLWRMCCTKEPEAARVAYMAMSAG